MKLNTKRILMFAAAIAANALIDRAWPKTTLPTPVVGAMVLFLIDFKINSILYRHKIKKLNQKIEYYQAEQLKDEATIQNQQADLVAQQKQLMQLYDIDSTVTYILPNKKVVTTKPKMN